MPSVRREHGSWVSDQPAAQLRLDEAELRRVYAPSAIAAGWSLTHDRAVRRAQPAVGCVGRVVPVVQKPKSVDVAPGASVATQPGRVTSTTLPLRLTVPLHELLIVTAVDRSKRSARGARGTVPRLVTAIPAQ